MSLTTEQRDLRDAVRGLLARGGTEAAGDEPARDEPARGERTLWRRLCGEVGVAGLAIPERYGGAGASAATRPGRWAGPGTWRASRSARSRSARPGGRWT